MIITWPRMQNVLLGISAFLMLTLLWSDMCFAIDASGARYSFRYSEYLPFIILTFVCTALLVAAICYRKQYILQIRVAVIAMLAQAGFQVWLAVMFFSLKGAYTFTISALMPLVCIILEVLAVRYSWREASDAMASDFRKKIRRKSK